jgi:hypothetical protein
MKRHGLLLAAILFCAMPRVVVAAWQNVPIPAGMQYARGICDTDPYLFVSFESYGGSFGGLFRTSSQAPGDWEYLGFSESRVFDIAMTAGDPAVLLVATADAEKVYRSTDQGSTWTSCGATLPGETGTTLHWDGGRPGRVYCITRQGTTDAISVSTNRGLSWSTLYSQPGGTYRSLLSSRGTGMPEVWRTFADLYSDTWVYRSTDGGTAWSSLPGMPSQFGRPAAICTPAGSERVYCLEYSDASGGQVRRWNGTAPDADWSVGFDGADLETPAWWNGRVVACGVAGDGRLSVAYRSEGDGAWSPLDDGLPSETSPSPDGAWWRFVLGSGATRPVLYFGTWTLGLWMRDMSDVVGVDDSIPLPASAGLRVLPNPAGRSVRFSLDGMPHCPIDLQVIDSAGRRVVSLPASEGGTTWDFKDDRGQAVPLGTYWVRTGTGAGASSVRFVHLR